MTFIWLDNLLQMLFKDPADHLLIAWWKHLLEVIYFSNNKVKYFSSPSQFVQGTLDKDSCVQINVPSSQAYLPNQVSLKSEINIIRQLDNVHANTKLDTFLPLREAHKFLGKSDINNKNQLFFKAKPLQRRKKLSNVPSITNLINLCPYQASQKQKQPLLLQCTIPFFLSVQLIQTQNGSCNVIQKPSQTKSLNSHQ